MQSDLPHTLYIRKGNKDNKAYSQSDVNEAAKLCEESLQRSRERRLKRQQEQGYTTTEIFNGEADK